MAISHTQPLLLLLMSLFFLPALASTSFFNCGEISWQSVTFSSVVVSPDPVKSSGNANITLTGFTRRIIPNTVTVDVRVTLAGRVPSSPKSYSLCDVTKCPLRPGPFVLTLSNIFNKNKRPPLGFRVDITAMTTMSPKRSVMCVVLEGDISD